MPWGSSRLCERVLAVVMAGGRGERLRPLTRDRTKPAVPFGGQYRIVDFVLSNLINSGIDRIYVLTQYKAQSLLEHLQRAWIHMRGRESFITSVPAQMQQGDAWYRGTADAIYQNLNLLQRCAHDLVAVFGADHIYKMNVGQMVEFHLRKHAAATIACLPVPIEQASAFGVVCVDENWRVTGFEEKPARPTPLPGRPGFALVSMGNYIFHSQLLVDILQRDHADPTSRHDFGRSILPPLVESQPVYAYDFQRNSIPREREEELAYWRDIGTIDAYYQANLDLKNVLPKLNLYNWDWPIRTVAYHDPPVKFVFDERGRRGAAIQSVISGGCILAGGYVKDSVLGRNVFVDAGAEITDSILFDNVYIGPDVKVRRAIIDKNVRVPAGSLVCADGALDEDLYHVTRSGIVVLPRAQDSPESRAWNF